MNKRSSNTFVTTQWTEVLASQGSSERAQQALSDLCEAYYGPVVWFLRHDGRDEESARELAHEFFKRVLERPSFPGANPARGRFRSYLLGALKHFVANERARTAREKRGGQFRHESLDNDISLAAAVIDDIAAPPDALFDREWAVNILERAFSVMKREAAENKRVHEFETLKPFLAGQVAAPVQSAVARELKMTDGAMRVAIHRLRSRFRQVVREEVRQTVSSPGDLDSEMQHLIAALT